LSGGQQSNDTLHDNAIGWGILLVILGLLVWLFWSYFHVEVRDMVRWIRYGEMWVLSWILPSDYQFSFLGGEYGFHDHLNGFEYQRRNGQLGYQPGVTDIEAQRLNYNHLAKFSAMTMQPLRMPIVFLFGLGAVWCVFNGPRTIYRKKMGLEELIGFQSSNFPVISPFTKFNPATQPPRPPGAPVPAELPLFAEALGPEEWLAYNSINPKDGEIGESEEEIKAAFQTQLGPRWRGAKALADYKQVLLAAFCLKASRKRTQADDFLGRLAKCWDFKGGMNLKKDPKLLKEALAVLNNKKLAGPTFAQANRHAFETTALLRALTYAREEGGVLAPAQFVWLRAHDRTLWYPLNNAGRQSFHMEALGAMSHFKAERLTQRPIPVPKLDHAYNTIVEYMSSTRARPIPSLDYSQSKKRGVKKAV
tara:strand:+ start:1354 stop:2613 length:1260 start_codon:yes stop_codon:yes gene_type:complete